MAVATGPRITMALPCLHAVSVYGKGQGDGWQVPDFVGHSKVQPLGTLLHKDNNGSKLLQSLAFSQWGQEQCASNL